MYTLENQCPSQLGSLTCSPEERAINNFSYVSPQNFSFNKQINKYMCYISMQNGTYTIFTILQLPLLTYSILKVFLYYHFQFFNVFCCNDVTINLTNHLEECLSCFSFWDFSVNVAIRIVIHTFFIHG